ncbi:MAG: hypothetical protein V4658_09890 [Bacteroidota bacterium]
MKNNALYAIILLLIGSAFLAFSKQNIQAVAFAAICFIFLTFPFTLFVVHLVKKLFGSHKQEEEIALGIGA